MPRKPIMQRVSEIGWDVTDKAPGLGPCWEWRGCCSPTGYPRVARGGKSGSEYVHRVMLAEKLGREVAGGMFACHRCDNRRCVNPEHLYEGSALDNSRDTVERGHLRRELCPSGHRLTYARDGSRRCAKCAAAARRVDAAATALGGRTGPVDLNPSPHEMDDALLFRLLVRAAHPIVCSGGDWHQVCIDRATAAMAALGRAMPGVDR